MFKSTMVFVRLVSDVSVLFRVYILCQSANGEATFSQHYACIYTLS